MRSILLIVLSAILLQGCASFSPRSTFLLDTLDAKNEQVLFVETKNPTDTKAQMFRLVKKQDTWEPIEPPMDVVIGRNSFAPMWQKEEGDGRTPSGAFALRRAFGYAPSVNTKLEYTQLTDEDFWVDDPKSSQYNRWIKGAPNAESYEKLKRDDELYKLAIVIEYNVDPITPGKGSAIFLHIWQDQNTPTAGCVATSEENMLTLLEWLDPKKNPVIVLSE